MRGASWDQIVNEILMMSQLFYFHSLRDYTMIGKKSVLIDLRDLTFQKKNFSPTSRVLDRCADARSLLRSNFCFSVRSRVHPTPVH
jgi:hypothetical protein